MPIDQVVVRFGREAVARIQHRSPVPAGLVLEICIEIAFVVVRLHHRIAEQVFPHRKPPHQVLVGLVKVQEFALVPCRELPAGDRLFRLLIVRPGEIDLSQLVIEGGVGPAGQVVVDQERGRSEKDHQCGQKKQLAEHRAGSIPFHREDCRIPCAVLGWKHWCGFASALPFPGGDKCIFLFRHGKFGIKRFINRDAARTAGRPRTEPQQVEGMHRGHVTHVIPRTILRQEDPPHPDLFAVADRRIKQAVLFGVLAAQGGIAGDRHPKRGVLLLQCPMRHMYRDLLADRAVSFQHLVRDAEGVFFDMARIGRHAVGDHPPVRLPGEQVSEQAIGARFPHIHLYPAFLQQRSGGCGQPALHIHPVDTAPENRPDFKQNWVQQFGSLLLVFGVRGDPHQKFAIGREQLDLWIFRIQVPLKQGAQLGFFDPEQAEGPGKNRRRGKSGQIRHNALVEHRKELVRVIGDHQKELPPGRDRTSGGNPLDARKDDRLFGHHRQLDRLLGHLPPRVQVGFPDSALALLMQHQTPPKPCADRFF